MINRIRQIPFLFIALAYSGIAVEPAPAAQPRDRILIGIRVEGVNASVITLLKHELPLPAALVDCGRYRLTAAWGEVPLSYQGCLCSTLTSMQLCNKAPPL